jgi:hypothetical protein
MLATLGVVLSHSPVTVAGTNGVPVKGTYAYFHGGQVVCQSGATIPRGTDAIRVSLGANVGPRVGLRVLSRSTVVSEGVRAAGWGITETVTVPVRRVLNTIFNTTVCTTLGAAVEPIGANGELVATAAGGDTGRLRMEYLRPAHSSWVSLASSVARHMGIGHAPSGTWVAYLVLALMTAVSIIASRLVVREATTHGHVTRRIGMSDRTVTSPPGRGMRAIPRAAWICGLVAVLNAACWSVITPPFQVPDEPAHFAYAQLLAETGRLPTSNQGIIPQEQATVMEGLHQPEVQWHPEVRTISTRSEERQLDSDLSAHLNHIGPPDAGVAASEPPGYYALETVPYYLGSSGTLLDRLELMRLLSALMAGLTALFTFLFIRESLPAAPWAWTVGGLAAALLPLLGFSSGAVNPDAMLCAVCAAAFYCLARGFRRGLTRRLAIALGALIAVGLLTKLSFIGLAPGVMLGLVALAYRRARGQTTGNGIDVARPKRALRPIAIAVAVALSPAVVYVLSNLLEHHHTLGIVSKAINDLKGDPLGNTISYIWQFYLPRLPGMPHYFPGLSTVRQLWFDRAVGLYGWLDTPFPVWVYNLALVPAGLIAMLGLRALIARRAALRAHLPEILVYLAMSIGLMVLIGGISYTAKRTEGASYLQPRYLLPLLPLAGATLALAARGAGRRWGPSVGVLIVVLFLAQDVFSQLQVVARYYG